jgi:hypothetical protein
MDNARRCTYKSCSDVDVIFGERANLGDDYQINGRKLKNKPGEGRLVSLRTFLGRS